MTTENVYTICGMCTVRCPMVAEVENSNIRFLHGNPNAPGMKTSLCARGVAGKALINDNERIRHPMIRDGQRGEGKWRKVSWEEALDFTAEKLQKVVDKYGPRGVALSDRGGPFRDFHRAFLRGLGSPNYVNHDSSCARNVQHAAKSVSGAGRKDVAYDYRNARHVILQMRNVFEAIGVQEVNDLTDAMNEGCRLTVIDIRANVSATKADRFFMVRPGTDYAFNLAVINELLTKDLYNKDFARKYIQDLEALKSFAKDYTPQWAETETGVPAAQIRSFVHQLAKDAPAVLWHPGWMMARYDTTFYLCRSIYIINALLGSYGAKGGLPFVNKPKDAGYSGLKTFQDLFEKPREKRADGVGWRYTHFEEGPGLAHLLYEAMETGDPYPVKGYIAFRHDPLMAYPEPDRLRQIFDNLDLLVSVTFTWCDTAWYADVVLPLSPYLERDSVLAVKNALQPYFFMRRRAVEPRFDTKACWEIFSGLARRLGINELAYDKIEDIWNFQLQGTGVSIEDFNETGMVNLTKGPVYKDRDNLKFGTKSGKFEIISQKLEDLGMPCLKPYESAQNPPEGYFRLTFGRCGQHTQGHTVNNPILGELVPENVLWIHTDAAEKLHIENNETVNVSNNGYSEQIKAKVTDFIHPEAVFVIHGFGHKLPVESRAYGKGLADNKFMPGALKKWDPVGGAVAMQENFVKVTKVK
ncbi:MAG: molybdopterin-dependent oxidoreductase [Thermodesulfobacteriota bacterium]|nr:molybdopterin-dependent oxidoreductase [Thermodesulfobacteriota bacterium]